MVSTARIVKCLVLLDVISRHWGYNSFRPLQQEAMAASLDGRDSLVVLPTGGGKSLCYQAPAVVRDGLAVVVSPLIALMKDQVDGLERIGVPAVRLDSSLDSQQRQGAEPATREGTARLTYRVLPKLDPLDQVRDVLDRHRGDAGIIYCLRRKDVDVMAASLKHAGYRAVPYHAGMSADERRESQNAFASEAADVVVATIA